MIIAVSKPVRVLMFIALLVCVLALGVLLRASGIDCEGLKGFAGC